MAVDAPERKEFFYTRIGLYWLYLWSGFFFFVGGAILFPVLRHFLGFQHMNFGINELYAGVIFGLWFVFIGLRGVSEGFYRRPLVAVDSEGLFYRPHSSSIIPWRDISNVEWHREPAGEDGNTFGNYILVTRHSARRILIDVGVLPGYHGNSPVYTAIMRAWKRHGGTA